MINFKQVVGFAFPPRIYTGVAKSILTAMGIVLNGIFKGFIDLYKKIDDDLSITPQVYLLEKILNDKYDKEQRRIYIEEAKDTLGYFFFRVNDPPSNKFYFNKAWFVEDTRYGNVGVGFVVVLPMDISATDQMRAFINRYKLISIKYQIINK